MKNKKSISLIKATTLVSLTFMLMVLPACESKTENTAEDVGEAIEDTADEAADAVKDATN